MGRSARGSLQFATVVEKLGLTRNEAEALGLELLPRAFPKIDARLAAFSAAYRASSTAGKPPTLRAIAAQLAAQGHTTRTGAPLSLDTLSRLRGRAARAGMIPRDVRHRSAKDRQLRLIVENTPNPNPNPPAIVDPRASGEAVFSADPA